MATRREEMLVKHQRVAEYLDGHDLDAIVLAQRPNFAWYTAGGLNHVGTADSTGAAALLITRDKALCITNNIEAPRLAEEELADLGIEVRAGAWHVDSELPRIWASCIGALRTAADVALPVLPAHVTRLGSDFASLRWVMTQGEIERYRILAREVAESLETACRRTRRGMNEWDLASLITANALTRGIRTSVLLVAADARISSFRHPIPTGLVFDGYGMGVLGGERHGLTVSVTRLFSLSPVGADLRRRHAAVCHVDAAMISATRPGRGMGEVISIAQQTYAEQGFADEWTYHHQGGLTGYLGREIRVGPGNPTPIQAGQVYAWNPSIAGTKSEDTILIGPTENEIISQTGRWPTTTYESQGRSWPRCDILEI
jgi:Xaa-Pro aminopeptidase